MLLKAHLNLPQQSMDLIARAWRQAELFVLGAILPAETETPEVPLDPVPARRWASLDEVVQALIFMLDEPTYVTGENPAHRRRAEPGVGGVYYG